MQIEQEEYLTAQEAENLMKNFTAMSGSYLYLNNGIIVPMYFWYTTNQNCEAEVYATESKIKDMDKFEDAIFNATIQNLGSFDILPKGLENKLDKIKINIIEIGTKITNMPDPLYAMSELFVEIGYAREMTFEEEAQLGYLFEVTQ